MQTKKNKIYDVSAELDSVFGPVGSESRKAAEKLAWEEYISTFYRLAAAMGFTVELRPTF